MRYRGPLLLILGLTLSDGAALAEEVACRTLPFPVQGSREQFGYSVAASGATTAIGANKGSTVLVGRGTDFQPPLTAGGQDDQFGFATALTSIPGTDGGDWLAVGAPMADLGSRDAGAVYLFLRGENGDWNLKKTLPGDGAAGAQFGFTVALHGNTLAVGAVMDGDGGTLSGAIYVFERAGTDWILQKKFPGAQPFDGLGSAIAVGDGIVAAGAPFVDGPAGGNQGAVHLFTKVSNSNEWTESPQALLASEAKAGDQFGYAVSIEGTTLAVGARRGDVRGMVDAGWVALFSRAEGSWTESEPRLTGGKAGELFGIAVALSGQ
jgi:hypothetical protein